jgi:hypothetical protein
VPPTKLNPAKSGVWRDIKGGSGGFPNELLMAAFDPNATLANGPDPTRCGHMAIC